MKKLIAQRPIQYLGRYYERGAALPANDPLMTEAWLKAGSAAWEETDRESVAAAIQEAARRSKVNDMAADAIRALGVTLEDPTGEFVGEERLKEQLCGLVQELLPGYEDVVPAAGGPEGGALPEDEDKILDTDPDGHFTRTSLSRLTKAELLDLAEDLGVDLSGCRTNAERVEALAAVDAAAILEAGKPDPPPEGLPPEAPA